MAAVSPLSAYRQLFRLLGCYGLRPQRNGSVDLPRFGGRLRAWDQGVRFAAIAPPLDDLFVRLRASFRPGLRDATAVVWSGSRGRPGCGPKCGWNSGDAVTGNMKISF